MSARRLGAVAVLSGAMLLASPVVAHAEPLSATSGIANPSSIQASAVNINAGGLFGAQANLGEDPVASAVPSDASPAVTTEGRSPLDEAIETTKDFAAVAPHHESLGDMGVSIERLAAQQERQRTKEIELAYIDAAVKEAQAERARIAEEERLAAQAAERAAALANEALSHVGAPYVSGGTAPDGFDCSGLVKYCVAQVYGYDMPRTAAAQAGEGESVSFSDLRAGDLLFWGQGSGIWHVAIYIGDGQYVHAPRPGQSVKVQTLESYTPTFAKRLVF